MPFQILDCTLRDGGYYTNWDFDEDLVEIYVNSVSRAPISYVEAGYCSPPKPFYRGEWGFLAKERLQWVRSCLRDDQTLGVMLDAKDWKPALVRDLLGDLAGVIEMVRMAIAPKDFAVGISLARELKKLGFMVGFNTMYLSKYSGDLDELKPLLADVDAFDILALVDSYGGCTPGEVSRKTQLAKSMFPNTPIGFHGHDNICLGFANSLAAVDAGAEVIDSTFVGMGRGAGNTRTEMLIVHKVNCGEVDGEDDALEAAAQVAERFERLRDEYKWGTSLPYMMSGAANLPQKDVMDWLGKNRYSPVTVIRALQSQSVGAVDNDPYPDLRSNSLLAQASEVTVIIGGGSSVERHLKAILHFVKNTGAAVIHANTRFQNLIGKFGTYELLSLSGHAAHLLPPDVDMGQLTGAIVPQPPRFRGTVPTQPGCPVFQCAPYGAEQSDTLGPVSDIGPLALAVGAAKALSARRIYLVGFDGYENASIAQQELASEIQATLDRLVAEPDVFVASLTSTLYDVPSRSVYIAAEFLEI